MQMPATANPLDQLKDIHTPDAIGLWPPAIGWYLVAAFLIAALVLAGVILWRRWQQNAYRRAALRECDDIEREITAGSDSRAAAIRIATLLKRTALSVFRRAEVASLSGDAWILFLESKASEAHFSITSSQLLIEASFRENPPDNQSDVARLLDEARRWIRKHQRPNAASGGEHA